MSTPRKILNFVFAFAIGEATWIAWLLSGFSTGGITVMLERAITLARGSERVRALKDRLRRHRVREQRSALALSSSW